MSGRQETVFVLMPFSPEFHEVYEDAIKPVVESQGLRCLRADEIFDNKDIVEDVENAIQEALLLVAELTGRNPNVLYEAGYARALDKEVIMLTQNENDVPFDLRNRRYIRYGTSGRQLTELQKKLTKTLHTVVPRARRSEHARREQEVSSDVVKAIREQISSMAGGLLESETGETSGFPTPVFHTARLKAMQAACQSNLKQLALAAMMFETDEKRFPDANKWRDQLTPYVRNVALFSCPAQSESQHGYAMNAALSGAHVSRLVDPSRTPLFFDSDPKLAKSSGGFEALAKPPRHLQRNNIAFADGHVESINDDRIDELLWDITVA